MTKSQCTLSVILPVYNQYSALLKTLNGLGQQNKREEEYEIIVIDDGSQDELAKTASEDLQELCPNLSLFHFENQGRAAARNRGLERAKADKIVFCDSDRVPEPDFLEKHLACLQHSEVTIGFALDYFGKQVVEEAYPINWPMVQRFSRRPAYLKRVETLYDAQGDSDSKLRFISFLVGNAGVSKRALERVGGFNEKYREWGVEHFEIAYRLQKEGYTFHLCREAINHHIPHPRPQGFYKEQIAKGIKQLCADHPSIREEILEQVLWSNVRLDTLETAIFTEEN